MTSIFMVSMYQHKYPANRFFDNNPNLIQKLISRQVKPGKKQRTIPSWLLMFIIFAGCLFFFYTHASANSYNLNDKFIDRIKLICIYEVHNGHLRPRVFTGNDIKTLKAIQVNGYITGIVLFSTEQMVVSVADQQMDSIQINRDGTYELKYFGNFNRRELLTIFSDSENPVDHFPDLDQMAGRYSYFPEIQGDAVSTQKAFNITLSGNNDSLTLPVNQTGSRKFYNTSPVKMEPPVGPVFQDIGNSLNPFDTVSPDFKQRIAALSKGIETAESGFQIKLVDTINILNYNGFNNAYSYKDKTEIWIYKQTFWEVSVQELHSLSEHEACHILVDRSDFTLSSTLRNHYADLKGYGNFSKERYMLLTHGSVSGADSKRTSPGSLFFAFINEKNFIQGMTGGHSQDNMAEFYASFLHSMLYIDQLYNNLERPITLSGGKEHFLTKREKKQILNKYKHTLNLLMAAARENPGTKNLSRFLQTAELKLKHGTGFPNPSGGRDS